MAPRRVPRDPGDARAFGDPRPEGAVGGALPARRTPLRQDGDATILRPVYPRAGVNRVPPPEEESPPSGTPSEEGSSDSENQKDQTMPSAEEEGFSRLGASLGASGGGVFLPSAAGAALASAARARGSPSAEFSEDLRCWSGLCGKGELIEPLEERRKGLAAGFPSTSPVRGDCLLHMSIFFALFLQARLDAHAKRENTEYAGLFACGPYGTARLSHDA